MLSGFAPMRTCEITAPPFWASPVMSSTVAAFASRCAAMPIRAPSVTTPVPPMPVSTMFHGSFMAMGAGSGTSSIASPAEAPGSTAMRSCPPRTLTKAGQSPFRHE